MSALTCDVLVLGSGAAGLTAAATAAAHGLKVIVAEKAATFGGASALSGGWVWIPLNPAAVRDGIDDSYEAAETYVRAEAGELFDADRVTSYLRHGPEMVRFLEEHGLVRFETEGHGFSDYHPDRPGGRPGGRSIVAAPFDGRRLGPALKDLRPPLKQQTFLGLLIGSGSTLKHFLNVTKSLTSAVVVARTLAWHGFEVLRYGRGVRLHNGSALIAWLARGGLDHGVEMLLSCPARRLIRDGGRVAGAVVERDGREVEIRASCGVVLATGGFARDEAVRTARYPAGQRESLAPEENAGDGLRMALAAGAAINADMHAAAYGMVLSGLPERDGSTTWYAHLFERAKPGVIAVTSDGRRFCNESDSYHDMVQAMLREGVDGEARRAYFIADHRAIRRYGLGAARPAPVPLGRFLRDGYLKRAASVAELAGLIGIEPAALEATVAAFNAGARDGVDPLFRRGESAYNRFQGDPGHRPNPCLAPLETGPFYAVEVVPGDLGTFVGLRADGRGRVLDAAGAPIAGLYTAGNDSANVFSGACLGAGVTIGPAMVYGFIVGSELAGRDEQRQAASANTTQAATAPGTRPSTPAAR